MWERRFELLRALNIVRDDVMVWTCATNWACSIACILAVKIFDVTMVLLSKAKLPCYSIILTEMTAGFLSCQSISLHDPMTDMFTRPVSVPTGHSAFSSKGNLKPDIIQHISAFSSPVKLKRKLKYSFQLSCKANLLITGVSKLEIRFQLKKETWKLTSHSRFQLSALL